MQAISAEFLSEYSLKEHLLVNELGKDFNVKLINIKTRQVIHVEFKFNCEDQGKLSSGGNDTPDSHHDLTFLSSFASVCRSNI